MTPRMELQADQVRTVMTAGDRLDDITRARMWSAIGDQVTAPAPAARPARASRTAAITLGALAVAAAAILVVRARGTDATDQLTVAADATLTHRLGPHARAALVGPARLELLGPASPATSVRLHSGTLIAEFDGGPKRSLRVEAGDLVAEVVGTLFAIEVTGERACVAVAHGTVRVTSRGSIRLVTDHQQLCSGDATPHAIPAATADQLARHERALAIAMGGPDSAPTAATPPFEAPPVAPSAPTPSIDAPPLAPAAAAPAASVEAAAPTSAAPTIPSSRSESPDAPLARSSKNEPERAPTAPRPTVTAQRTPVQGSDPTSPSKTEPERAPRSSVATSALARTRTDATSSPDAAPPASVTVTTAPPPASTPARAPVTATTPTRANEPTPATPPANDPTATSPRASVTAPTRTSVTSVPTSPRGPVTDRMPTVPNAPAPTTPAGPPPPAVPPAPSAEELYRAAEVALAAGDRAAAVRALKRILSLPGRALADQALYELARIEYQRRAWTAAREHLAALALIAGTPLAEPGRYLDCRIAVEAKASDAERCFIGYRTAYPRSPHDLDVLAVLVQLVHARAGCDGARTLRDELIGRYPRTDHAAAWRSRCAEAP